jgi:hypothetical protein
MRRLLACLVALALSTAVLWADTTVVTDTFTEAANTALASHVPDSGAPGAWANDEDTGAGAAFRVNGALDLVDTAASGLNGRVSYTVTPTIALSGADYYAELTLTNAQDSSADDLTGIRLRRTAATTYYIGAWYASATVNDCYIAKVITGTWTQLANADCGFVDASVVKFGVSGDTLTLYKDGASVLTVAGGSAITATGAAGLLCGNVRVAGDDCTTTLQFDNFSVVDTTVAAGGNSTGAFQLLLQAWRALANGWALA